MQRKKWLVMFLTVLAVLGLNGFLRWYRPAVMERSNLGLQNFFMLRRSPVTVSDEVVVAGIDEKSFAKTRTMALESSSDWGSFSRDFRFKSRSSCI